IFGSASNIVIYDNSTSEVSCSGSTVKETSFRFWLLEKTSCTRFISVVIFGQMPRQRVKKKAPIKIFPSNCYVPDVSPFRLISMNEGIVCPSGPSMGNLLSLNRHPHAAKMNTKKMMTLLITRKIEIYC